MFAMDIPCILLLFTSILRKEEGLEFRKHNSLTHLPLPHSMVMLYCVVMDKRTSWCCLRVLCFFEATFISTLGRVYFQDLETASVVLVTRISGEKSNLRGFHVR